MILEGTYILAFYYYLNHAHLEELGTCWQRRFWGEGLSLFSRFGLAGALDVHLCRHIYNLIMFGISTICFILAIPYIYYGWTILLVHTVTFLFNIGINIHIIIAMAL